MGATLLGVAGFPIGHSRSPAIQNAALSALGLDWLYVALPLPRELFTEVAVSLGASGYRGINVTMPHKRAAHDLADRRTPAAAAIGAANTLTYADDGIAADNTDAGGLLDALAVDPAGRRALVLGAGGSARAAVWALREAGADVAVWNRTPERARALAEEFGVRALGRPAQAEILVNCTSVGLDGTLSPEDGVAALELGGLEPPEVVCDLVYGSEPTPLERWARAIGARSVGGLEVLVHQGARSLAGWTGREPPLAVMHAAAQQR